MTFISIILYRNTRDSQYTYILVQERIINNNLENIFRLTNVPKFVGIFRAVKG